MMFKDGVEIAGLRAEALVGLVTCNEIYRQHGYSCVVTSITDGRHSRGSLHYVGLAFDLRTRHIPPSSQILVKKDIQDALTHEFDVVLEKDHLHIEFQPKG